MKKQEKNTAKPGTAPASDRLPAPGKDRSNLPKLSISDKLRQKLKKLRKDDPNIYPLW